MDDVLLKNMHANVGPTDQLWIIGDFAFGRKASDSTYLERIFAQLPGEEKHLIVGNRPRANARAPMDLQIALHRDQRRPTEPTQHPVPLPDDNSEPRPQRCATAVWPRPQQLARFPQLSKRWRRLVGFRTRAVQGYC